MESYLALVLLTDDQDRQKYILYIGSKNNGHLLVSYSYFIILLYQILAGHTNLNHSRNNSAIAFKFKLLLNFLQS